MEEQKGGGVKEDALCPSHEFKLEKSRTENSRIFGSCSSGSWKCKVEGRELHPNQRPVLRGRNPASRSPQGDLTCPAFSLWTAECTSQDTTSFTVAHWRRQ